MSYIKKESDILLKILENTGEQTTWFWVCLWKKECKTLVGTERRYPAPQQVVVGESGEAIGTTSQWSKTAQMALR